MLFLANKKKFLFLFTTLCYFLNPGFSRSYHHSVDNSIHIIQRHSKLTYTTYPHLFTGLCSKQLFLLFFWLFNIQNVDNREDGDTRKLIIELWITGLFIFSCITARVNHRLFASFCQLSKCFPAWLLTFQYTDLNRFY